MNYIGDSKILKNLFLNFGFKKIQIIQNKFLISFEPIIKFEKKDNIQKK